MIIKAIINYIKAKGNFVVSAEQAPRHDPIDYIWIKCIKSGKEKFLFFKKPTDYHPCDIIISPTNPKFLELLDIVLEEMYE